MAEFFDDFNRANNADLGGDWTVVSPQGPFSISSNTALEGDGASAEYVNSITPSDDQFAEAVLSGAQESVDGLSGIGVAVRVATAAETYYCLMANAVTTGELILRKVVAGTLTELAQYTAGSAPVAGDTIRLEVEGTDLRVYHNTVLRITHGPDSSITAGRVGIAANSNVEAPALDTFLGGDLLSDPTIIRSRKLATQQRMVA